MVALRTEDTGSLIMEITIGPDTEAHLGLEPPKETTLMGPTVSTAAPAVSADVHDLCHRSLDRNTPCAPPCRTEGGGAEALDGRRGTGAGRR